MFNFIIESYIVFNSLFMLLYFDIFYDDDDDDDDRWYGRTCDAYPMESPSVSMELIL